MQTILLIVFTPLFLSPMIFVNDSRIRQFVSIVSVSILFYASYIILLNSDFKAFQLFTSFLQSNDGTALISFSMHPYSRIAAFGFTFVGALGILYGIQISKPAEQVASFAAIASAVGVAYSDTFISFLFFWELLTITTSMLIFMKGTKAAMHAAYRVFFLQLAGGFSITIGIILNYNATGSFAVQIPEAGLLFFLLGIGVKAAFLLLHYWVPWGYPEAAFPSSVLLAALCTKVGVYGVARVLPSGDLMALMGASMAIVAVSFAILQSDLRRLLSFHIISQVGYMIAGIGLGSAYGVDGGLLHLVNHMIYKALLFMSAGAVLYTTGTENVHELHHPHTGKQGPNLWRVMPLVAIGAIVGALAISGTPFFNGYVSKYLLKKAAYGINPVETMLLVAGVGTALSFAKFVYFGFIDAKIKTFRRPTLTMNIAIALSAISCILLGVWPDLIKSIIPYSSSLHVYSLSSAWAALRVILIGILVFILIARYMEKIKFSPRLSADYLVYTPLTKGSLFVFSSAGRLLDSIANQIIVGSPGVLMVLSKSFDRFDSGLTVDYGRRIADFFPVLFDKTYDLWMVIIDYVFGRSRRFLLRLFYVMFKFDYKTLGDRRYQNINISNIDFDLFVVLIVIGAILATSLLFIFN